jgi:hypothetical protein
MRMLSVWLIHCANIYTGGHYSSSTLSSNKNTSGESTSGETNNDNDLWSSLVMLKQFLLKAYQPRASALWKTLIQDIKNHCSNESGISLTNNKNHDYDVVMKREIEKFPETYSEQLEKELYFASTRAEQKLDHRYFNTTMDLD